MRRCEILYPGDLEPDEQPETLHPGHFYAAYIFDRPEARQDHIRQIIDESQRLGYWLRYWWLSDAIPLEGSSDRLIVCVHHPSSTEDAGMDLYNALKKQSMAWDDLEAAAMDEYQIYGRKIKELANIRSPNGEQLFATNLPEDK